MSQLPIVFSTTCECGHTVRRSMPPDEQFIQVETLRVRCRQCGSVVVAEK